MAGQKQRETAAPVDHQEGPRKRKTSKTKNQKNTNKQSKGKKSEKRECRGPFPGISSEYKWWKIIAAAAFVLLTCFSIYVIFFSTTQEGPSEVFPSTEGLDEKLASKISSCPKGMQEKCKAYWYDVNFLRQNPSQAILVMNAGGVTQSQCFGTFVDFSPYKVTALFTAAHCHNKATNETIVEIIYYDQKLNQIAFKSIEDFIPIEHPSLRFQKIKSSIYSHLYAEYNFDITLLLSTERLAVKGAKLREKGQKLTGTYITPYFKVNYDEVKMVNVKLVDSNSCEKSYNDNKMTIKNFQEVKTKGGENEQREIQICVDRGSGYVRTGHSGGSLLVWDGQEYYFLGAYSRGPNPKQNVPHLYVAPGSLEEIIETFSYTSNWQDLIIIA